MVAFFVILENRTPLLLSYSQVACPYRLRVAFSLSPSVHLLLGLVRAAPSGANPSPGPHSGLPSDLAEIRECDDIKLWAVRWSLD
jgi:hypothetical protein